MAKAKSTRAQLPAQTQDAAPPPGEQPPVNPVHDEAGPPPAADQPLVFHTKAIDFSAFRAKFDDVATIARLPAVEAYFHRLEQVRGLPEVVGDVETQPIEFAPGSIERFKASETDRRTMGVIALPGAGFAQRAVATEEA